MSPEEAEQVVKIRRGIQAVALSMVSLGAHMRPIIDLLERIDQSLRELQGTHPDSDAS